MSPMREMATAMGPRGRSHYSTVQLGSELVLAGVIMVVLSLIIEFNYVIAATVHPATLIGWLIFSLTVLSMVIWLRHTGVVLGTLSFRIFLIPLAIAVFADYWAVTNAVAVYPTVAIAAAGLLTAVSPLRRTFELLVCWVFLGATYVAVLAEAALRGGPNLATGVMLLALAICPLAIAIFMVASYRTMVSRALDRVLLDGAVDAPAFDTSPEIHSELVALDREIEKFFDDVATGTTPLPLSPAQARRAGELATTLRSYLISASTDTWFVHAITQTKLLDRLVQVEDPRGLAGSLNREQRDGLLSAVWLICTPQLYETPRVIVEFAPGASPLMVRITLEIDAMTRLDIEPATWPALDRVGRYGIVSTREGVRITVHCHISPTRGTTP